MPTVIEVDLDELADLDKLLENSDDDDDSIAASADEEEEAVDPLVTFDVEEIPATITDVIKLMDKLQPGHNYYERQQDSNKECGKTRGKLRAYARKQENATDLAVSHWVQTKSWKPPNRASLSALMCLIRSMINKSWPMS